MENPRLSKLPKEQLKKGGIYKIFSRNLEYGVYDGNNGFIGLREKFNSLYLFTEYYADGGPYGTVYPKEEIGTLPSEIEIRTSSDTIDKMNGRFLAFDKPVVDGGRGWYYTDNNENADQKTVRPTCYSNESLFKYLEQLEKSQEKS